MINENDIRNAYTHSYKLVSRMQPAGSFSNSLLANFPAFIVATQIIHLFLKPREIGQDIARVRRLG